MIPKFGTNFFRNAPSLMTSLPALESKIEPEQQRPAPDRRVRRQWWQADSLPTQRNSAYRLHHLLFPVQSQAGASCHHRIPAIPKAVGVDVSQIARRRGKRLLGHPDELTALRENHLGVHV